MTAATSGNHSARTTPGGGPSGDDRCSVAAPSGPAPPGRADDPRHRPPALRRGRATCRSSPRTGTCRPTGSPTTSRSATRPRLLISPDHYVTRLLHANGVPLDEPRRRRHAAHRRTGRGAAWRALCTALGRLPRHAEPVLAGERARRHLRGDRAAVRRDRRRDLRPGRRRPCAGPTSGRARCCSASASRCWPRPTTRADDLAHHAAIRDDADGLDPGAADVPPRPLPRAGPDATGRSWSTRSAPRPTSTPATTRASSPRWRTGAGTSSRTAPSPPTTATPTSAPPRSTRPTPSGSSRRPARARRRRRRPPRCAATCCWRWRGCRSRTAWS